jgi:hypothetical protein
MPAVDQHSFDRAGKDLRCKRFVIERMHLLFTLSIFVNILSLLHLTSPF